MTLLSILVVSLKCRAALRERLLSILQPQVDAHPNVELLIEEDDGEATIGDKRNRLLERAAGRHLCFCDDDDTVSSSYVASLVSALSTDPDCVGFRAEWFEDGRKTGDVTYSLSVANVPTCGVERQKNSDGLFEIERKPTHLTPVRTEFARAVRFMPWCYGEDRDYSIRLQPYLKREVFVDQVLYRYLLINRDARAHEKVNALRWNDDNFRIERSLGRAVAIAQEIQAQTVPPDTDR